MAVSRIQVVKVTCWVLTWPPSQISFLTSYSSYLFITLENSQIEFYLNDKPLSDQKCTPQILNGATTLFSIIPFLVFLWNNKFSTDAVCPYIFSNSKLDFFTITCQFDTILTRNLWKSQVLNRV
jgi:hypothetical protein